MKFDSVSRRPFILPVGKLNWLLFATLASFVLAAMPILPGFNTIRFAAAAVFLCSLIMFGRNWKIKLPAPSMLLILFSGWCFLTTLWSEQPNLSLLKGASQLLVISSLYFGSFLLAERHPQLFWRFGNALVLLTLVAVLISFVVGSPWNLRGPPHLKGLFGISVTLGFLLFVSFMVVSRSAIQEIGFKRKAFPLGILLITLAMLAFNQSRSAYLSIVVSLIYLVIVSQNRKLILYVCIGVLTISTLIFQAIGFDAFYEQYILKGSTENEGVFASREEPFEQTLEGAQRGGLFGLGYGVSFDGGDFQISSTAVGYGREKASSQLAIVEETGLLGFFIYIGFCIALFFRNVPVKSSLSTRFEKAILLGAIVHSGVEAWWVAPGSMQMAVFLVLSGAFFGGVQGGTPRSARMARNYPNQKAF